MVLEKSLKSPLHSKEIKLVNPNGNQPWIFIERTDAEAQCFGHLMERADLLEKTLMLGKIEGKGEEMRMRMRWLDNITNSTDMNLGELQEMERDREALAVL